MSKPKKPRCMLCDRPAYAAIEEIATGHQTPVCWFHRRVAVSGSRSPGFEYVKLGGGTALSTAEPAGERRTPAAGIVSGADAG